MEFYNSTYSMLNLTNDLTLTDRACFALHHSDGAGVRQAGSLRTV